MTTTNRWSQADIDTAVRMRAEGAKYPAIGEFLGCTDNAARHALRRIGVETVKRQASWSEGELRRAKAAWEGGKSGRETGAIVGRSRNAVIRMAQRMGWKSPKLDTVHHALQVKQGRRDRPKLKCKPPANVLKFGGVRMSPDIKLPVALPPAEPSPEHAVGLVARTSRQCCYPVGEAVGADQLYCGATKAGDSHDYCAWHYKVMYTGRKAA